jgi:prepilin-type N-terminal cleavage/methylation domain-containing protein
MQRATPHGFSLLELLVAISVFLVVSAASFTLFSRHQALLSKEQGLAGLNIGLRNTLTQIQVDVVNAGNGLIMGAFVPAWPVGVTIINQNPSTPCNVPSTHSYTATCFDTLNVIAVDPNTPAWRPQTSTGGIIDTSAQNTLYAGPISTSYTASAYYKNFKLGDTVLLVDATGSPYTTVTLTADGALSSDNSMIVLTYTKTSGPTPGPAGINPNDLLSITTSATPDDLGVSYGTSDWLVRLAPIIYSVDTSDTTNPKLMRQRGSGSPDVVMEQVVSFKVGAAIWGSTTSGFDYLYNAASTGADGYSNNFTLVRAIRVSLIARTKPSTDPSYTFRNAFDQGPYQVLGSSIIVNPRNLSMNNN